MRMLDAAAWGLAGGGVAGLVAISGAVATAHFRWPWRGRHELWPYIFVRISALAIGTVVAAAMHDQVSGPWPALLAGATAPALVRGILERVEVKETKDGLPTDGDTDASS